MNLGDKLRQLRHDRGLTQPGLAEAMGIEQSYLSKLENDKSVPSGAMLQRILDVFGIDVAGLVDDLDEGVRNQLRQIPEVAAYLNGRRRRSFELRRRWIVVSGLLVSFGAGLAFAGASGLFYADFVYQYRSDGVVLEGEPREVFRNPHLGVSSAATADEINAAVDRIRSRIDEVFWPSTEFLGTMFNMPVDGGSRTWYLENEVEIDPWQNKAVTFAGIVLLVAGAIGLAYRNAAYDGRR